jgi:predicted lactoylglutathione lyase
LQLLNGTEATAVELALCIGVPVILFVIGLIRWLHYKNVHPKEVAEVNQAHQDNIEIKEAYEKHIDEIIAEANEILKANNLS